MGKHLLIAFFGIIALCIIVTEMEIRSPKAREEVVNTPKNDINAFTQKEKEKFNIRTDAYINLYSYCETVSKLACDRRLRDVYNKHLSETSFGMRNEETKLYNVMQAWFDVVRESKIIERINKGN